MLLQIKQVQLVLFSPGIVISDKAKLAVKINKELQTLFNGDPVMPPIPGDAPLEIPRIVLKSKNERYILQISVKRVNFFYNSPPENSAVKFPVNGLYEKFIAISKCLGGETYCQFLRSAIVTQWIVELGKSGTQYIASNYLRKDVPFKNPYNLELHYLTKENIAGCRVNKWVRIKTTRRISDPTQNNFLTVLIDINTVADEKYKVDTKLLMQFLNESSKFIEETMDRHFRNKGV
ncbi:MAG: hypothetical protein U9O41_10365 [Candidatus Aerophobetes bacterium]|nr:hypothetical protein [Candidatus Aerophobetes bacterium]